MKLFKINAMKGLYRSGVAVVFSVVAASTAVADCEVFHYLDSNQNKVASYYDDENFKVGSALILPPAGGAASTDRNLASKLCERGLNAVIWDYTQRKPDLDDLDSHDKITEQTFTWLNEYLADSDQPVVVIGASLGSLFSEMILAEANNPNSKFKNFKRVKAAVLTVAGGPLSEILATSQLKPIAENRNKRLERFHYKNPDEYRQVMEKHTFWDPMKHASPTMRDQLLMFTSTEDTTVPSVTQEKLWHALGEPTRHFFASDHVWTIGRVYYFYTTLIYNFAVDHLGIKRDAEVSEELYWE